MDIIDYETIEYLESYLEEINADLDIHSERNKHNQKIFDSIREKEQAKRAIEDIADNETIDIELRGGIGNQLLYSTKGLATEKINATDLSFGQLVDKLETSKPIADPNRSIIGDLKVINGTPESKIKIAIRKKFLLIQMNWTFDDDKFLVLAEQLESMLQLEQDIKEED